ncbi:MAG: 3-keto-5-aminohexanoate cleavage protein [Deltaproteobacteria bacterium]|nr:3-keto-5-aminohexanoate cleavage protein [Deltaproteobacteria bacterium]
MSDKIVITAALTGAATRKEQNPGIPYRPEEWATEVKRCEDAGAAVVAVHFRDYETGDATVDATVMHETMEAIHSNCNCLVNLSTGVSLESTLEEKKQPVIQHRPEMASLNPGSINFNSVNWATGEIISDHTYQNPYNASLEFGRIMKERKIKPEMECFTPSHIENVLWMSRHYKLFEEPLHFGFVFGVAGAMQFNLPNLANCVSLIPHDATWNGIGVGPNCYKVCAAAAALGGHVRVGLEDNIWIDNTSRALSKGSWDQVEKAVEIARQVGRTPATPDQARKIFHTRSKDE